jgi:cobalamin biosynthesis protein CobT
MANKPTTPLGAVRGFEIMNSLGDTMRTVLETNKPFTEDFAAGGLSVAFNGNEAFSSWARNAAGGISGILNAPSLAPDAHLSRHQADLYVGYGLHEMGHMCYSDHGPFQKMNERQGTMGVALLKALEDPRVEQAVMQSKMAGNSRALFENLACAMYSNAITQGYDANSINWLPLTLSLLGRDRRGQHFPESKDIRAAMNPENLSLVDEALAMMDKAPLTSDGTQDARAAAQYIIDKLNLPPQPNPPPQGKGKGQSQKGPGKPQEGQKDGTQGDNDDGECQGEGDAEEGQGSSPGQGNEEGEGQDAGDGKGEKGKPGDYADGGGGKGYSRHGSGAKWTKVDLSKATPKQVGPEQAIDQAAKHANAQAIRSGSHFDPYEFPSAIGNEYDFRHGKSYSSYLHHGASQEKYEQLKRRLPSDLGSMRHALWRLLNSRDEAYVDRYREAGRWDNRAMPRMLTGGTSLYKMTTEVMGLRTAVSIIVDASGSMSGNSAVNSASVCIALAETMEQLAGHGVVYQIACFEDFDGGTRDGQNAANDFLHKFSLRTNWRNAGTSKINHARRTLVPQDKMNWTRRLNETRATWAANIAIFKGFNDRLATCREAISTMANFVGGGTPDAAGVGRAIYHVLNRPEPNKIVMVITDGCGQEDEVRSFCKFGAEVGVDVIGVGIGDTSVRKVYPISVTASSIEALGKAAFGKMVQVVLNNRRRQGRQAT